MENNYNKELENTNEYDYDYEEIPPTRESNTDPEYTPPLNKEPSYTPPLNTNPTTVKTGMAIAAFVLGLIAFFTTFFGINIVIGIIGIVLAGAYLSKKQPELRGLAIAGLILSIISIAIFVLLVVLIIVFIASGTMSMFFSDPMYGEFYYDVMNEFY